MSTDCHVMKLMVKHGQPCAAMCLQESGSRWGFYGIKMVALPDLIVLLQFIVFIYLMKLVLYIESCFGGVGVRFSETREILHTHTEAPSYKTSSKQPLKH